MWLKRMDQTCTSRFVKRSSSWSVRSDKWSGWSVGVDRGRLGADASRSAFIRGARHRKWTPFSIKSPRFKKLKGQDVSNGPQQTCSRSIPVISVCLFHRAPDKSSLYCTCIMNARMRLQIHCEYDFIIYHIFPRSVWFNTHLQIQPHAGEMLWENRQLSFASLHFGIDWPLFTFHMDTHMQTETSKQPPKITNTHADYRKSEIIAYQFSLSPVWRPSRSQRGRRGQIIAYQEKWTVNELASKEKNGGVCSSRGLTLLKCRQVIIIKKKQVTNVNLSQDI